MLVIYISEAHATDVWPIGESSGAQNKKHCSIKDRATCAANFATEFKVDLPTFVDSMDSTYETTFAAWPFRYHVIQNNKLVKIGMPDESEFDILELFDFLNKLML